MFSGNSSVVGNGHGKLKFMAFGIVLSLGEYN